MHPVRLGRYAPFGFILILISVTGFSLWAVTAAGTEGTVVDASYAIARSYAGAIGALDTQGVLQYQYGVQGDARTMHAFWRESRTFQRTVRQLQREERDLGIRQAPLPAQVEGRYAAYLADAHRFFALHPSRDGRVMRRMEVRRLAPLRDRIWRDLQRAWRSDRGVVEGDLTRIQSSQLVARFGALMALPISILLLTVLALLRMRWVRDDAQRKVEMTRLSEAALTDSITGLGNHRAFQEALQAEIALSLRHNYPLTLALVDVDEFKVLNDASGHAHGDRVLSELARILESGRAGDKAFRVGGDEMALVLSHTDALHAQSVLERVRLDAEVRLFGVTVSAGVAQVSAEHDTALLREQADAALYEAKRRGRNTVVRFDEICHAVSILSPSKVTAVRRILSDRRLNVAFQPIWDLERGCVMAYEALMRPHPDYELSGPLEAFEIAERLGRSHELDAVCRDGILARAHELPPDVLLFVNLAPQTLDHDMLAGDTLVQAVQAAGLSPARVVLEVTERAMPRLHVVTREVKRLRALGFKVALDDVGAGNAGLEVLRQVPVDFLKIDRSVIASSQHDIMAHAVLAGIVAFARQTDTFVIAEGIEDVEMLQFLRQQEVVRKRTIRGGQGFFLGKPSEVITESGRVSA